MVAELVRQHGAARSPAVSPLVSEVRSDDVPITPPPPPPPLKGTCLDGIVVIWYFCLPHRLVEGFHDFLRKNEGFIVGGVAKLSGKKAVYLGTHLILSGTEACCTGVAKGVCYRVVWRYDSLADMATAWQLATEKKSNLYRAVVRLRAYWLQDPHRSESRSVFAAGFFDPKGPAEDHFARLTLDAARLTL
jgi:hypothetical protein